MARWPDLLCPAGGGGPEGEATAPRRAEAGRAGERGASASPPALRHCTSFLPQPLHSPGLSGELDSKLGWLASHRLPLSVGSARQPGGRGQRRGRACVCSVPGPASRRVLPGVCCCLLLSALYLPRRLPPTSPGPSVFPSALRMPQPPISTLRRPRRSTHTCWSQTGSSEESSRSFRPASWSWSPRWSCCRPRVRGCRSMSGGLNPCAPPPRRLPPAL